MTADETPTNTLDTKGQDLCFQHLGMVNWLICEREFNNHPILFLIDRSHPVHDQFLAGMETGRALRRKQPAGFISHSEWHTCEHGTLVMTTAEMAVTMLRLLYSALPEPVVAAVATVYADHVLVVHASDRITVVKTRTLGNHDLLDLDELTDETVRAMLAGCMPNHALARLLLMACGGDVDDVVLAARQTLQERSTEQDLSSPAATPNGELAVVFVARNSPHFADVESSDGEIVGGITLTITESSDPSPELGIVLACERATAHAFAVGVEPSLQDVAVTPSDDDLVLPCYFFFASGVVVDEYAVTRPEDE